MNSVGIAMAFLMGLTGSLHCAGMCGPIMLVMPFQMLQGYKKWLGIFLYHFGRTTIYVLLGLLLHSFTSLFHPEWQQYISITLGVSLLIVGIVSFLPSNKIVVHLPWTGFVKNKLGNFICHPKLSNFLFTGMLNGLLPCGLVYMALSMAVTASSTLQSIVLIYAFGAGTVPMLVAIAIVKNKINLFRINIRKMVPVIMFLFGCLFILRGMDLGIPYLSPKISVEHETVKANCCYHPD